MTDIPVRLCGRIGNQKKEGMEGSPPRRGAAPVDCFGWKNSNNLKIFNLNLSTISKLFRSIPLVALALAGTMATADASVYDDWQVPGVKSALTSYGAIMPYTRYDCNAANEAVLSGGASLKTAPDWDAYNKATSASSQTYVDLPIGASVAWKATTEGDGVTIRYTIKDSHEGGTGKAGGYAEGEGHLEIYVNGQKAGDMDISSYHMYQYFSYGSGSPSQNSGGAPAFCFDERHVQLNKMIRPNDTIEVKCTKGHEVGVDFLELEVVPVRRSRRHSMQPVRWGASCSYRKAHGIWATTAREDMVFFRSRART